MESWGEPFGRPIGSEGFSPDSMWLAGLGGIGHPVDRDVRFQSFEFDDCADVCACEPSALELCDFVGQGSRPVGGRLVPAT